MQELMKVVDEEATIQFELITLDEFENERKQIQNGIETIDEQLAQLEEKVDNLNAIIERETNNADWFDYLVAISSGILCGLIDVVFVGELKIKEETVKIDKKIREAVIEKAKEEKIDETLKKAIEKAKEKGKTLSNEELGKIKEGVLKSFEKDKNNLAQQGGDPILSKAISYLEKKHPVLQDNLFQGKGFSSASHHLDDVAHHPTIAGLIASIVIQYFRVAEYVNKEGKRKFVIVSTSLKDLLDAWLPILIAGLFNWLIFLTEKKRESPEFDVPKPIFKIVNILSTAPAVIEVLKVADIWCKHLYSDVAGSSTSAKKGRRGKGIPGLFISFLKELSNTPPLNHTGLPKALDYLYNTLEFDLRKEIALTKELGRQSIPIIINELLVRSFYFVRRLVVGYKENNGWNGINWDVVIPIGNRTVERMMTIASGTFCAIDLTDAAVHGFKEAAKAPGEAAVKTAAFAKGFLLRVNYVGVGRFFVSIGVDCKMGIDCYFNKLERAKYIMEIANLNTAKYFYCSSDGWIRINTIYDITIETEYCKTMALEQTINLCQTISDTIGNYMELVCKVNKDTIPDEFPEKIRTTNPGLIEELLNIKN